jgi:hypothetical protein
MMSVFPNLQQVGTSNGTPIFADFGDGWQPVSLQFLQPYTLLMPGPALIPTRPFNDGAAVSQVVSQISAGQTFTFHQGEANALIAAGVAELA